MTAPSRRRVRHDAPQNQTGGYYPDNAAANAQTKRDTRRPATRTQIRITAHDAPERETSPPRTRNAPPAPLQRAQSAGVHRERSYPSLDHPLNRADVMVRYEGTPKA